MRTTERLLLFLGALTIASTQLSTATLDAAPKPRSTHESASRRAVPGPELLKRVESLPLRFEPNRGQTDPRVQFLSRLGAHALFLTRDGAVVTLKKSPGEDAESGRDSLLRLTWVGASRRSHIAGVEELPGKSHYLIGRTRAEWHTNVPSYSSVRYTGIYPGIDLLYYGDGGRLEYDFLVAPGASPDAVRLKLTGADRVRLDRNGDLAISVDGALGHPANLDFEDVQITRERQPPPPRDDIKGTRF